jgi:hypothetical protein
MRVEGGRCGFSGPAVALKGSRSFECLTSRNQEIVTLHQRSGYLRRNHIGDKRASLGLTERLKTLQWFVPEFLRKDRAERC